jgi:hypothetical protein
LGAYTSCEATGRPVKQRCRVQHPLHGGNTTTRTMKAPLTPIFLKEEAQQDP